MNRLVPVLVLVIFTGCAARAPLPAFVGAPIQVQLVDSVPWVDEVSEGVLRRVELRYAGRTDTIPGVLTTSVPVQVGPSTVLGIAYEADAAKYVFEYDVARSQSSFHKLPRDVNPYFSVPAFSPDGRHLAYVVIPGDATGWAITRTWPQGDLVWQSPVVKAPATDATGGNHVRWISPGMAEVFIEIGEVTGRTWYRVLGSATERKVVRADTMHLAPGS